MILNVLGGHGRSERPFFSASRPTVAGHCPLQHCPLALLLFVFERAERPVYPFPLVSSHEARLEDGGGVETKRGGVEDGCGADAVFTALVARHVDGGEGGERGPGAPRLDRDHVHAPLDPAVAHLCNTRAGFSRFVVGGSA